MALLLLRAGALLFVLASAIADDDTKVEYYDTEVVLWPRGGTRSATLRCVPAGGVRMTVLPTRKAPPPLLDPSSGPAASISRRSNQSYAPYIWWQNGREVSNKRVSANGAIEVHRRRGTEGLYQCGLRSAFGLILGYPINLKFPSLEKQFLAQPDNITAEKGQPVLFACNITSTPPAVVEWERDRLSLPPDKRYYYFNSYLLITDVNMKDAGKYRCMARNFRVNKRKISREGELRIIETTTYIMPKFVPDHQELNIEVTIGNGLSLSCAFYGRPRPQVVWDFTSFRDNSTKTLAEYKQILTLKGQLQEEGMYSCKIPGPTTLIKKINVTVTSPVRLVLVPESKEVLSASTVRFNCTATGYPDPVITWYKDGLLLNITGKIKLLKSAYDDRTELVISGATSDDAGVYQCFAQSRDSVASEWAALNVTGGGSAAPAPNTVTCAPLGPTSIYLEWRHPTPLNVIAYTIHYTPTDGGKEQNDVYNRIPTSFEHSFTVKEPLTTYTFYVKAYVKTPTGKSMASEQSESVVCQGQGVPIRTTKNADGSVTVSWYDFASELSGVSQWMLQYREENVDEVRSLILDSSVNKYTFPAHNNSHLMVRVLGSKSKEWLPQNLSLLAWSSTRDISDYNNEIQFGSTSITPTSLSITDITPHTVRISWRYDNKRHSDSDYTFTVCTTQSDTLGVTHGIEICNSSSNNSAEINNLTPSTQYEVKVLVRLVNGNIESYSEPYHFATPPAETRRFKDVTFMFLSGTSVRVSWTMNDDVGSNSTKASIVVPSYTVHYSNDLELSMDQWKKQYVQGNSSVINDLDPIHYTYVMITAYAPTDHSQVLTIPPQTQITEPFKDLRYDYIDDNEVYITWNTLTGDNYISNKMYYTVRYSLYLTIPIDKWTKLNVSGNSVQISLADPIRETYVMISVRGTESHSRVLTIFPRKHDKSALPLGIIFGSAVCLTCLFSVTFVLIWKRRKRTLRRSRGRFDTTNVVPNNQGSELKVNGGNILGADEPLLNGHVNITENPTILKTPNGRLKRRNRSITYESPFDVSRYEDNDNTLETTLEGDLSTDTCPHYNLLDTSRLQEFDISNSSELNASHNPDMQQNIVISSNSSYNKLPDDNMNSKSPVDGADENSIPMDVDQNRIGPPTLQPNG